MSIEGKFDGRFALEGHSKTNPSQYVAELMNSVRHRLLTEKQHLSLEQVHQVLEAMSRTIVYLWSYVNAPKCTNQKLINTQPLVPAVTNPVVVKFEFTPQGFYNALVERAKGTGLKPWISVGSIREAAKHNPDVKALFKDVNGEAMCDFDQLDAYYGTPKAKATYNKIYPKRLKWKEKLNEFERQKRQGEANS